MKKILFITLLFILFFTAQPVSAGVIDDGINMIALGMDKYVVHMSENILNNSYGVTFANNSQIANYKPSQKLVYEVAAAQQSPYEVESVQQTFATELVWYMIIGLLIIVIIGGLNIIQKAFPEEVSGTYEMFTGHEGFFDYTATLKTTLKLGLMPILALPIIDTLLTLEQLISSGMTADSLTFINSPAPQTAGIWIFEAIAYAICSWIFFLRIAYINAFCSHILIIILLLCLTWSVSKYIGELFIAWFLSALFMRPIVLWFSCLAVQDIASQPNNALAVAATAADMTIVVIASFLVALFLVFWPIIMLIVKVISNYLLGTGYKIIKISNQIKMMRRQ
jgi:hypothetical protein